MSECKTDRTLSVSETDEVLPDADVSAISKAETDDKKSHSSRKLIGGIAAILALVPFAPAGAAERLGTKPTQGLNVSQTDKLIAVRKPKCSPRNLILFSLRGPNTVSPTNKHTYKLTVKRCKSSSKKTFKTIVLSQTSTLGKKKAWKAEKLAPGKKKQKSFSINLTATEAVKKKLDPKKAQSIKLEAKTLNGKKIGKGEWKVKYTPAVGARSIGSGDELVEDEECKPRSDFKVGIQDDSAFVWQQHGNREEALRLAAETYGARVIRFNVLYDDWKKYGPAAFISLINAVEKYNRENNYNYELMATLMSTPAYRPDGDQSLSYRNPSKDGMKNYAYDVVTTLGPNVKVIEIMNEPNHKFFLESQNYNVYENMAIGGVEGVNSANPNTQVILGGLAPSSAEGMIEWIEGLRDKADGVSLHPYGDLIEPQYIRRFVAAAGGGIGTPLDLTEYSRFAHTPNHVSGNKKDIEVVRCLGVRTIIMYLVYDVIDGESNWHTGFVKVFKPPRSSSVPAPAPEPAIP